MQYAAVYIDGSTLVAVEHILVPHTATISEYSVGCCLCERDGCRTLDEAFLLHLGSAYALRAHGHLSLGALFLRPIGFGLADIREAVRRFSRGDVLIEGVLEDDPLGVEFGGGNEHGGVPSAGALAAVVEGVAHGGVLVTVPAVPTDTNGLVVDVHALVAQRDRRSAGGIDKAESGHIDS